MTNFPDHTTGTHIPPQYAPEGAPVRGAPAYGSSPYAMVPSFPQGQPFQQPMYSGGPIGKVRNPFVVFLLPFFTFGIYFLYWHFKVNEELANYDRRIEVNPTLSLLALFVPIVGYVSIWNTGTRVAMAQNLSGRFQTCSGALGTVLAFFILGNTFYYQSELNNLWRSRQG